MVLATLFLLILCINLSFCSKFPPNLKKCDRNQKDFAQCLPKSLEDALKQLTKPIKNVNLPSLNPIEIPAVTVESGTRAVQLTLNFQNLKLFGIPAAHCTEYKVDFAGKTMSAKLLVANLTLVTNYDLHGKVLLIDVYGKGDASIYFDDMSLDIEFTLAEYVKNSQKYFSVIKTNLVLNPKFATYKFEGLYGGNQQLSDAIHKVANENWKEVFDDVKPSYGKMFGEVAASVFNGFFSKVPIVDVFGNE